MNWLQKTSQQTTLWHATTAQLAEEIIEDGKISPSLTLGDLKGKNYSGWNFDQLNQIYGEGVYLAKTADLAIQYADIRLRREWEEMSDLVKLDIDENFKYLGLFRVHIINLAKLQPVNETYTNHSNETTNEFQFKGIILSTPNSEAWFESPKWVSRSRDLETFLTNRAKIQQQFDTQFNHNDY